MSYLYTRSAGRKYHQQQWAIAQSRAAKAERYAELKAKEKRMDEILVAAELRPAHKVTLKVTPKDAPDTPLWSRRLNAATLKKWALSVEDARRILEAQGWACVICEEPFTRTPHIDHCHRTGQRRSFLCYQCNPGLGMFRDNPDYLRRAADYLEAHRRPEGTEGLDEIADAAITVARRDTFEMPT